MADLSILVCIKAVPDHPCGDGLSLREDWIDESPVSWTMNPYDAHALEAALEIKDAVPGVNVDALSLGPDRVRGVIRRAMAMGADAGIQLVMETAGRPDAATVAAAIADVAGSGAYDLILTGAVSEDLMQGVTGPMIAATLDLPCAVAAVNLKPSPADRSVEVRCEMEAGMTESMRLRLPALVTVQTGSRRPRYPSLSNTLRSRRQPIARIAPRAAPPLRRATATVRLADPSRVVDCDILQGTPQEKADRLLQMFNRKGWLK
jgi:electron transfer flavoprotein beta subunit